MKYNKKIKLKCTGRVQRVQRRQTTPTFAAVEPSLILMLVNFCAFIIRPPAMPDPLFTCIHSDLLYIFFIFFHGFFFAVVHFPLDFHELRLLLHSQEEKSKKGRRVLKIEKCSKFTWHSLCKQHKELSIRIGNNMKERERQRERNDDELIYVCVFTSCAFPKHFFPFPFSF